MYSCVGFNFYQFFFIFMLLKASVGRLSLISSFHTASMASSNGFKSDFRISKVVPGLISLINFDNEIVFKDCLAFLIQSMSRITWTFYSGNTENSWLTINTISRIIVLFPHKFRLRKRKNL